MKYSKMLQGIQKILKEKNLLCAGTYVSDEMQQAIELWSALYYGAVKRDKDDDTTKSAGLPAAISSELARLVTLEFESHITDVQPVPEAGDEPTDPVPAGEGTRAFYLDGIWQQKVLANLRTQVEYALAKGSMAFKPYFDGKGIVVQYCQADAFYPLSFNSDGVITQCAFTDTVKMLNQYYTRVELHTLIQGGVKVVNLAYKSINDDTLGTEVPLEEVSQWANLEADGMMLGADKLEFGFFKMPIANLIDTNSPMGFSCFGRSVDRIAVADKRYSQIDWEYDAKEAAVHIASSLLKYDVENDKYKYPGGKKRLYRELDYSTGANDKPLLEDYSPDIRDESYFHGYNQQLKRIEFDCGLAYGTLSDAQDVDKTAEEIKSSKQRSYTTVSDIQQALQKALDELIKAIDYYVSAYKLAPEGEYEVSYDWDDSIITDNELERQQDRADLAIGALELWEYIHKWRGKTIEEAKAIAGAYADQQASKEDDFGE